MADEQIAAPAHSAAKRLWFNDGLERTRHCMQGASPLNPVLCGRWSRDRDAQMSDESDAIHRELLDRWDCTIRPFLLSDGPRAAWHYTGPIENNDGFGDGLRRLEQLAEEGDLFAAEQVAELLALHGPAHDAAVAYKWYYIVLSQQGYSVEFRDENGTPPDYGGPTGDFRNESMVSGLVSELGFERVQELDRIAAEWLARKGLSPG